MSYRETILTDEQGRQVIQNFKQSLEEACRSYSKKGEDDNGILYVTLGLFARLDDLADEYGEGVIGTCLQIKRSSINIHLRWLYYKSKQQDVIDDQEEWVYDLIFDLIGMANEVISELEKEKDVEKVEMDDITIPIENKKMTKKEREAEYRRERKRLQSLLRRREKAGVVVGMEIPNIPKKITSGSIRRLQQLAQKIKSAFRYLSGGRYRGMK